MANTYITGWCSTGQCERCAGVYGREDRRAVCSCPHHKKESSEDTRR